MTTTYDGTNTFPAGITIPSDGDPWNSALISQPLQQLADRTKALEWRTPGLATYTYHRTSILPKYVQGWEYSATYGRWMQTSVTGSEALIIPLELPTFGSLTQVTLQVATIGTVHTTIPGNLPRVTLYRRTFESGSRTFESATIDTRLDPFSSLPEYDNSHEITLYGFAENLSFASSRQAAYDLFIVGESGANAIAHRLVVQSIYSTVEAS